MDYWRALRKIKVAVVLVALACWVGLHRHFVLLLSYKQSLHQNAFNVIQKSAVFTVSTEFNTELQGPLRSHSPKMVLYWRPWAYSYLLGLGSKPFSGCRFSSCVATDNSSQLSQAAAVLFHGVTMRSGWLPPPRPPGQLWLFYMTECPLVRDVQFGLFDSLFNATMTYRSDSDVVSRYFEVTQRLQSDSAPNMGEFVKRNLTSMRLVAWVVSNCKTASRRERYVSRLQQHLQVDIYGRCSRDPNRKNCPSDLSGDQIRADKTSCYKYLAQRYLFYMAFENSFCKDYVTEKLLMPLQFGMVPVVRGLSRQEYERLTPPNSFIHVDDFNSMADLAGYLYHLRHHPEKYSRYHAWRRTHQVQKPRKAVLCRLCQFLHQQNPPLKQNGNVQQWWKNSSVCWRPE